MAGKLFQEYVVDGWATTEQLCLDWVQRNQTKIRADTYKGLTDALAVDPQMDATTWAKGLFFHLPLLAALDL